MCSSMSSWNAACGLPHASMIFFNPSELSDLEAGVRAGGENWTLVANFFRMDYRNQLVLDGRLNDVGAYIRTNVPQSDRAGLEVEASFRPVPRLLLTGNAALSRNKIRAFTEFIDDWDTGEQVIVTHRNTELAFSPNVIARGEIAFDLIPGGQRHALSLALAGKYVGEQYLDNTTNSHTALPGYFFSDLRLNYDLRKVIGKEVNLIIAVNNLLDARYSSNGWTYRFISQGYDPRPDDPYSRLEGADVYNLAGFFPQAGRNSMATLRMRF